MEQKTPNPTDNIHLEKKRLRSELAVRRNLQFAENSDPSSLALIPEQEWFQKSRIISIYVAQPFEFPTEGLFEICIRHQKTVCVPVMHGRNMIFQKIESMNHLVPNEKKIMEPLFGLEISPDRIDLFFVPLTAFDRNGNRLGRGVGYYDRLFSDPSVRGIKVGVGYEFQEFFSVPTEDHDVPMEFILTDKEIFRSL